MRDYMNNAYLFELLDELHERKFDYTITNGMFEMVLGNQHLNFHINDEDETYELIQMLSLW